MLQTKPARNLNVNLVLSASSGSSLWLFFSGDLILARVLVHSVGGAYACGGGSSVFLRNFHFEATFNPLSQVH
jgi:hypothetical protein